MMFIVFWQTILFISDAEEERRLLQQLKFTVDAANCCYIVQFFGAFLVEVSFSLNSDQNFQYAIITVARIGRIRRQ